MKLSNLIKKINKENAPEAGKLYALTGAPGSRCIANGHSCKDSEVKEPAPAAGTPNDRGTS